MKKKMKKKSRSLNKILIPGVITLLILIGVVLFGSIDSFQNLLKGELITEKCDKIGEVKQSKIDGLIADAEDEWEKLAAMEKTLTKVIDSKDSVDAFLEVGFVSSRESCPDLGVYQNQAFGLPTDLGVCIEKYEDSLKFAKFLADDKKKEKAKELVAEFVPLHTAFKKEFQGEKSSYNAYIRNIDLIADTIESFPEGTCVSKVKEQLHALKNNLNTFTLLGIGGQTGA